MVDFDKEQLAKRTQDHLNGYIKFADQKSSILLTAHLAFLGLYANLLKTAWEGSNLDFKIISGLTIVAGLIAVGLAGWTVYPRTPETEKGLMLWSNIEKMDIATYKNKIGSLDSKEAFQELLDENHKLASVAEKKYKHLRISLIFTAVTLAFAITAVCTLLM